MGTPLGPKYIPYTYMDPLGYVGTWSLWVVGPEPWHREDCDRAAIIPVMQRAGRSGKPSCRKQVWVSKN